MRRAVVRTSASGTPHFAQYSATGRCSKCGSTSARPSACAASQSRAIRPSCTITPISAASRKASRAGLHLEMDVGDLGGLAAARVDHDQRALRIVRDLPQGHARARDAVREPRVLAQEDRHLAVLEVAAREAAEHPVVDPELARLLLRERARLVARAEHGARGAPVRARQVIALPAAAVIEDRLAAVRVAHRGEARGHLADRGVPVDLLEACRRRGGGAASSAAADRSGRSRAARASRRRSPARSDAHRRRARARRRRPSGPPSCTSIPQLHSHRMQAVDFHSDAVAAISTLLARGAGAHALAARPGRRRLSQFGCVMQLILR